MTGLARTLHTIDELAAAGLIEPENKARLAPVTRRYAVAITPEMVRLIDRADPADPIAAQFVPDLGELEMRPGEHADPIGDRVHEKEPGVVHRYPDRVLLKLTHACPVYCRFCFRREVVGPGGDGIMTGEAFDAALAYIRQHPEIWEVVLTGGDPLMLSPRRLADVTARLSEIQHLQVLRWHTRVPVVDPCRVTLELIDALRSSSSLLQPKSIYVGIHCNHPRELTGAARQAIARLSDSGIALVSQTVLLQGINDDAEVLEELFRTFVALRIRPYYLHQADMAPGTARFRTSIAKGQALMRQLRGRISGLAVPTYILDIPGGHGKVPIGPPYIDDEGSLVADPSGAIHAYPPEAR